MIEFVALRQKTYSCLMYDGNSDDNNTDADNSDDYNSDDDNSNKKGMEQKMCNKTKT